MAGSGLTLLAEEEKTQQSLENYLDEKELISVYEAFLANFNCY